MLAEAENPEVHNSTFDMTYGWHLHFVMNEIAQQKKSSLDIIECLDKNLKNLIVQIIVYILHLIMMKILGKVTLKKIG